jgi:hypothetical protein
MIFIETFWSADGWPPKSRLKEVVVEQHGDVTSLVKVVAGDERLWVTNERIIDTSDRILIRYGAKFKMRKNDDVDQGS